MSAKKLLIIFAIDLKRKRMITSLSAFTRELTKDLQSINNDAHLGVDERRIFFKGGGSPEDLWKALFLKRAPFQNYGFKNVDRLLGNEIDP